MDNNTSPPQVFEGRAASNEQIPDVVEIALQSCCADTVKLHSTHNPMMMCPECKQIVKCFRDENTFRNYVRFCKSRHRKISIARHDGMQIVMYRTFSKFT